MLVTSQTNYLRGREGIEVTARINFVWTFHDGAVAFGGSDHVLQRVHVCVTDPSA
ncbi:MAG: hypothetical protein ACRENN_08890 [Candidatus Eiseniibacteriota bacterium]